MDKSKFYDGDFLIWLLIDKMGLTPFKLALIVLLISFTWNLIFSLAAGGSIDFIKNIYSLLWIFIIEPTLAGFYLWGSSAMLSLVERLERSNAIVLTQTDIEYIQNIYSNSGRQILSLLISIPVTIIFFIIYYNEVSTASLPLILALAHSFSFLFGAYVAIMLIFTLALNIWVLYNLFKNKNIKVAHPCSCSGLKALSDYSLKTAYLAALFALMIFLFINHYGTDTLYQYIDYTSSRLIFMSQMCSEDMFDGPIYKIELKYLMIYVGIPLYVIVAASCFFLPLYTAHLSMKAAKEKLLNNISLQFIENYDTVTANISEKGDLETKVGLIKQVKEFYELTEQFSDWPFDFKTYRRFLVSILATVFALISPIIIPIITNFLNNLFSNPP
jgi:hypothetical protein